MAISATAVKELRAKTGAGIMDCKEALKENDGDIGQAAGWLRQKASPKPRKSLLVRPARVVSAATFTWVVA